MRVAVFCLLFLAVAIRADDIFSGKWYATMNGPAACSPVGVVTIAPTESGSTLKSTWAVNDKCAEYGLTGAVELTAGIITDTTLTFKFKSGKGETKVDSVLTLAKSDSGLGVDIVYGGDVTTTTLNAFVKVTDADLAKIKEWKGFYSFKIKSGDSTTCCIPESLEITEPQTDVFAVKGKWSYSTGCENIKANGLDISKSNTNTHVEAFTFIQSNSAGVPISAVLGVDPKNTDAGLQFNNPLTATCQVAAYKGEAPPGGNSTLIIIVVLLIIAAIAIGGFCLYKSKQQSTQTPAYLRA